MNPNPTDEALTVDRDPTQGVSASPFETPSTAPSPGSARNLVLVVDPDHVAQRFIEAALATSTFQIEAAQNGQSAIEILQTTRVDAIVCETMLPDMGGRHLHARLRQTSRLRDLPFVFWSADEKVATKLGALRAGADDYLTKPIDAIELRTRLEIVVERSRRRLNEGARRNYALAGDSRGLPFPDLVGLLHLSKASGVLSMVTSRASARLFFDSGSIVHAVSGNLHGAEAVYALLREPTGQFEFEMRPCEIDAAERTIVDSPNALLMEGARLSDDSARNPSPGPTAQTIATLPLGAASFAAQPPTSALAAQFGASINDPFSLGELHVLDETELEAWTRTNNATARLHIFVVAELQAGVGAMLSLASPPGEREVFKGLTPGAKALTLAFWLRNERLLDLVLLDVNQPLAFLPRLRRQPNLLLFAPPAGDFFAVGVAARHDLERLLAERAPQLVVGVGNATLPTNLLTLFPGQQCATVVEVMAGHLGDTGTDLRQILSSALQSWGELAADGQPHIPR